MCCAVDIRLDVGCIQQINEASFGRLSRLPSLSRDNTDLTELYVDNIRGTTVERFCRANIIPLCRMKDLSWYPGSRPGQRAVLVGLIIIIKLDTSV